MTLLHHCPTGLPSTSGHTFPAEADRKCPSGLESKSTSSLEFLGYFITATETEVGQHCNQKPPETVISCAGLVVSRLQIQSSRMAEKESKGNTAFLSTRNLTERRLFIKSCSLMINQFNTDYTEGCPGSVSTAITKHLIAGKRQIIEVCLGCGSGDCEV